MDAMQKTMNSWWKNTSVFFSAGGTGFQNRLMKATYGSDEEMPKQKHARYVIEAIAGL